MTIAQALLQAKPQRDGALPVLFNGVAGPRLIGYAHDHEGADCLAISQRLSATFNSKAEQQGREFWLLHG